MESKRVKTYREEISSVDRYCIGIISCVDHCPIFITFLITSPYDDVQNIKFGLPDMFLRYADKIYTQINRKIQVFRIYGPYNV